MNYRVMKETPTWVFIIDTINGKSVTNDAERVCEALFREYGNKRIFYRDTVGVWDELVHASGIFKTFHLHNWTDYEISKLEEVKT